MMKHWNIKFVSSLVAVVALLGAVGEIYAIDGYDGTLQNMSDADWVTGKTGYGNALDFDGSNDWVLSSYTGSFNTDHTWAAWIKTTGNGTIISKSPQTGIWATGGKTIFLQNGKVRYDVGWVGFVETSVTVNDGTWHHVAVTVEFETSGTSDTATIYIDGQPEASKSDKNFNKDDSGLVLKVGHTNDNFGYNFAGLIDEVRVYDRVLSQSEIAVINVRPPDPVVYYEFNESSGSTAFDSSVDRELKFHSDPVDEVFAVENIAYTSSLADDASGPIGDELVFSMVSGPAWLNVASDGTLSGTPLFADIGANSWQVQVDAGDSSATATLNITVLAESFVAESPSPSFGQERIDTGTQLTLEWTVRSEVQWHRIYLGTDPSPTNLIATVGDVSGSGLQSYTYSGPLEKETVYYWRIDTVRNNGNDVTVGPVWNFKTEPELAVAFDEVLYIKRRPWSSDHYYTVIYNGTSNSDRFDSGNGIYIYNLHTQEHRPVVTAADFVAHGGSGTGIIGKMSLSFDATKVVFDYRNSGGEGFRIWEVNVDGTGLRQVTATPADEGQKLARYKDLNYHTDDMHPAYLPDGKIVFTSSRCENIILCNLTGVLVTMTLHRCDADGSNIEQLSQSPVSEFSPVVLDDGRIMYHRWEYVDKGSLPPKAIYTMNPDGTKPMELYGLDDGTMKCYMFPRPMPGNDNRIVCVTTNHYPQGNCVGSINMIDLTKDSRLGFGKDPDESGYQPGPDGVHACYNITPEVFMERNTEPGWRFSNGSGGFVNDTSGRSGHLFTMPYPVSSMDFLVSYKADPGSHYRDDANAYEIYLIDTEGKREPVCKDESGELSCWHPIPLASRKTPPKIHAHRIGALASQNKAFCIVTNVYDGIEGVQAGDVKWLRINEVVPRYWATRKIDWSPRITSTNWAGAAWARVQWGVVPVEDDGSASFYVPADRNIFLQALDKDFREIQRERTYVNYRPGEARSCIGCHTRGGNAPPKIAASAVKALLRPPSELQAQPCDDGQPNQVIHYPSDIQPIFDAKCVSCHGASSPSGGLSLVGTVTTKFSVSYEALLNTFSSYGDVPSQRLAGRLISEIYQHEIVEGTYLPAKSLGSYTSPMMARLLDPADTDHYGVLSENELMILSRWVDSNYQFYGTYYGRHHSDYSANPDFRREPTFEEAIEKYNRPDWHK